MKSAPTDLPQQIQPPAHLATMAGIMSKQPLTLRAHERADEARHLLVACRIHAAPVVDRVGRVRGILTATDLVNAGTEAAAKQVGDLMSRSVIVCSATDGPADVARMMVGGRIRHVPVVDDHEKLIGIVSGDDIARFVAVLAPQEEASHIASTPAMAVASTATFEACRRLLRRGGVSVLLVVGPRRVVGAIDQLGLLRQFDRPPGMRAADLADTQVERRAASASMGEVAGLLSSPLVRLVALGIPGDLIGVVTSSDVVAWLARTKPAAV